MAITKFVPEIWSALLLTSLKKNLVLASLCNRRYEGEIRGGGDTVRITSISRPTVQSYTRNSNITYEELNDAERTLVVDQEKYWAFTVDDVDRAQARGDFVSEAMDEAAYAIADVVDQYIASLHTQVAAGNALSTVSVPTANPSYVYDNILVPLGVKLDEANVPSEGRWCVIPPWLHGRLQRDDRFIDASAAADGGTALRRGYIGQAAGFQLYKSNNMPVVTGDDYLVLAGTSDAITFASQITKTEAMRSEDRFADRVRGLYVYGAKVIRPDGIATAFASQT
jgi:N4-gp56 family major capsid protein